VFGHLALLKGEVAALVVGASEEPSGLRHNPDAVFRGHFGRVDLSHRRRFAASSAVVPTFHMLSATLIVTPGGTISSM
jgi:hypothetical protein